MTTQIRKTTSSGGAAARMEGKLTWSPRTEEGRERRRGDGGAAAR
jgi:hypothetical protein